MAYIMRMEKHKKYEQWKLNHQEEGRLDSSIIYKSIKSI